MRTGSGQILAGAFGQFRLCRPSPALVALAGEPFAEGCAKSLIIFILSRAMSLPGNAPDGLAQCTRSLPRYPPPQIWNYEREQYFGARLPVRLTICLKMHGFGEFRRHAEASEAENARSSPPAEAVERWRSCLSGPATFILLPSEHSCARN